MHLAPWLYANLPDPVEPLASYFCRIFTRFWPSHLPDKPNNINPWIAAPVRAPRSMRTAPAWKACGMLHSKEKDHVLSNRGISQLGRLPCIRCGVWRRRCRRKRSRRGPAARGRNVHSTARPSPITVCESCSGIDVPNMSDSRYTVADLTTHPSKPAHPLSHFEQSPVVPPHP
jgi:hypothetical protein